MKTESKDELRIRIKMLEEENIRLRGEVEFLKGKIAGLEQNGYRGYPIITYPADGGAVTPPGWPWTGPTYSSGTDPAKIPPGPTVICGSSKSSTSRTDP